MDPSRASPLLNGKAQAILVIDDDQQVLKHVSRMLASIGFVCVFQAATISQALDLWSAHQREIDLVVSDFVMPEVTGDHLALRMIHEKPALKVLFISGNDPFSLDSAIPLRPGHNFLQKPFTIAEIRDSLSGMLGN
jgi:DNA-binding NtrC family response regulator